MAIPSLTHDAYSVLVQIYQRTGSQAKNLAKFKHDPLRVCHKKGVRQICFVIKEVILKCSFLRRTQEENWFRKNLKIRRQLKNQQVIIQPSRRAKYNSFWKSIHETKYFHIYIHVMVLFSRVDHRICTIVQHQISALLVI